MIVFFTCKNLLVVILQLYRLSIIATAKKDEDEDELKAFYPRKSLDTIKTVALAKSRFAKGLIKKKKKDATCTKAAPFSINDTEQPKA